MTSRQWRIETLIHPDINWGHVTRASRSVFRCFSMHSRYIPQENWEEPSCFVRSGDSVEISPCNVPFCSEFDSVVMLRPCHVLLSRQAVSMWKWRRRRRWWHFDGKCDDVDGILNSLATRIAIIPMTWGHDLIPTISSDLVGVIFDRLLRQELLHLWQRSVPSFQSAVQRDSGLHRWNGRTGGLWWALHPSPDRVILWSRV